MTYPYGGGRHRGVSLDAWDVSAAQLWSDPDPYTEDETPTARFVLNPYRGLLEYEEDDAPTARFVLNPYREAPHDPFGAGAGMRSRPAAVIEGEVVWRGSRPPDPEDAEPETAQIVLPPLLTVVGSGASWEAPGFAASAVNAFTGAGGRAGAASVRQDDADDADGEDDARSGWGVGRGGDFGRGGDYGPAGDFGPGGDVGPSEGFGPPEGFSALVGAGMPGEFGTGGNLGVPGDFGTTGVFGTAGDLGGSGDFAAPGDEGWTGDGEPGGGLLRGGDPADDGGWIGDDASPAWSDAGSQWPDRGDSDRGDSDRGDSDRGDSGLEHPGRGGSGREHPGRGDLGPVGHGREDLATGDVGPADPGREDLGPSTVGGAAQGIVRELAPGEMDRFPIVMQRFFADEVLQRRVVRWALSGARRDDPLALQLGGPDADLVSALTLAMLTCAATGALGHVGTRHHGGVARWRRNRGAARRRLAHGAATTLPRLSSLGAATVGQIVEEAAEDAGLTYDRARRLSILVLSALTRPVH